MTTMSDKLEPLAIVGMKWRFSGEANSASGFWDVLTNARSAKSRIQADRFNVDAHYHPSADRNGSIIKEGHFLKEGIAASMRPSSQWQQRRQRAWTLSIAFFWRSLMRRLRMLGLSRDADRIPWLAALLETEIHTMSRTCQLVVVPACWRPDLS
ncbi:putative polyketide synthase [Aspergillus fumigatus Af293]|uniref:Polyketide synthase, putative n=2 Tax=Aspergillus fumigatus TaxID=746128 RepID=Q4WAK8_ASPFU|nr:polyketide synthase, putative [Aspergillus fumigatus Af293]EAL84728.2 polyketide synthase, putative [Aspergillus fumigatus Af293]EDP48113.1 polyketide synthase, putative [Aspergillus fumigatus A1163]